MEMEAPGACVLSSSCMGADHLWDAIFLDEEAELFSPALPGGFSTAGYTGSPSS